jgi:hypothetical protein
VHEEAEGDKRCEGDEAGLPGTAHEEEGPEGNSEGHPYNGYDAENGQVSGHPTLFVGHGERYSLRYLSAGVGGFKRYPAGSQLYSTRPAAWRVESEVNAPSIFGAFWQAPDWVAMTEVPALSSS